MASPAQATYSKGKHTHSCDCGDKTGRKMCGGSTSTSSSTSGGTTTTSGGTTSTSGGTTTSGGSTSGGTTSTSGGSSGGSSGGTAVPEPGMLGMLGAGLIGLAYARRRKARA
ncbi:PEP-CTERM sorting domain-containing protein [Novosphingobium resinovorum]